MIKLNKKSNRLIKGFFVTFLVISWLLTGFPTLWISPRLQFPPKIPDSFAATALTAYSTGTNDTLVTTARQLTNSAPAAETSVTNKIGKLLNWDELDSQGDTANWAQLASEPAPSGSGFIWDVTTLEGQQIVAGNWTPSVKLKVSVGSIVADIHVRASVRSSAGAYTTILDAVSTAQTINTTATTYTLPATSGAVTNFNTGDKLYIDILLKVTTNSTGSTTATVTMYENGGAAEQVVTPGYQVQPVTTIADGINPGNSAIGPGGAITDLDAFTLATNVGTDTVTAATVTLNPAGAFNNIAQVDVTDNTNVAKCTAATGLTSNTVSMTGCTLAVVVGATTFKIRITPKSHANMPAPPGASYDTTGTITAFTSTNPQSGVDTASATVTIDNLSPNGATLTSGTAGNTAVTINWTTSNSADFATTNGSVVLRWAAATAGAEVPAEGTTSYAAGNAIGTATVACVISSAASTAQSKIDGTGGSVGCTTTALTNGQAYTYKVFQVDTSGNYDVGVLIGTFTPAAAVSTFTQNKYRWYQDNNLADPTVAWGTPAIAENTAITVIPAGKNPPDSATALRLRVNYVVNTANLPISSNYFKLEFKAGTDGSCTTGTWTDVGTGAWAYGTSTVTDGSNITAVLSDTTAGLGEQYAKSKPTALNHVAATTTQIIEYDFHILGTSSVANTTYSFRVVGTNSTGTTETIFDAYTNCPTLTTRPGTADLMRHGNVFTNSVKQGFFWAN